MNNGLRWISTQTVFRLLLRAGLFSALLYLFFLSPQPCRGEPAFFLSAKNLSWADYKPDRAQEIAPVIDLCGNWEYRAGDKSGTIAVPSSYTDFDGPVTFTKKFVVPGEWRGRSLFLKLFGVRHRAAFQLNGALLGSRQSNGVPFEILIPEQLVKYDLPNELVIEVDNRRSASRTLPLRSSIFAPKNFGGIVREVFLEARPPERINQLQIQEREIAEYYQSSALDREAKIEVTLSLQLQSENGPADLQVEVYDRRNNRIIRKKTTLEPNPEDRISTKEFQLAIPDPRRWKPGEANLYRLICSLNRGRKELDRVEKSFGLRFFPISNGNPDQTAIDSIREKLGILQGIVRVEQWPQSGVSPSKRELESEISLIRNLGVRWVRCAFYPPHPYFLNLCDSLGIALFVEIPLFGVSNNLLAENQLQSAATTAMDDLLMLAEDHPCIVAVGWGSGLEPTAVRNGGILATLSEDLPLNLPYYAHTIGSEDRAAAVHLFPFGQASAAHAVIGISDITASSGSLSGVDGDLEQVRQLVNKFSELPGAQTEFFLNYFNNWFGDRPLIYNPPARSAYLHETGLTDGDRRPRTAFFKLREYFQSGIVATTEHSERPPRESPWEFLVIGGLFTVFGLWMARNDKLFRQNLHRAMAHSLGFFSDIRDRRFLQGSQTGIIAIMLCVGVGNWLASLGFHWRLLSGFSALMEHLVGNDALLTMLRMMIWIPIRGVLFASLVALLLTLFVALIIRIGSSKKTSRLSLVQSLSLLSWSSVPALMILPISALFLRFSGLPTLQWAIALIIVWVLAWSYIRLINALSIAYRSGIGKPLILVAGLPLLILAVYLIRLQVTRQSLDYIAYFVNLFTAG